MQTANRSALYFILGFVVSVTLLFLSLLIDSYRLVAVYHSAGFYLLFFTVAYWAFLLLPRAPVNPGAWLSSHWKEALLIVGLTALMFLVSPIQFRILADETNLVSISYSMFRDHSFKNITETLNFYSQHHTLKFAWDIRPNFFPFLIYIVHVVKGYSAYNGFIVNFFAGVLALGSLYWLLLRWFRAEVAVLGVFLLAAYPVYVLWVTSSGFEILNLGMALLAFCFLYQYLEDRQNIYLERLLLTLVLLAQTRYESAVFVIAIGVVILLSTRKEQLACWPFRFWFIPWLFLPIAWQRLIKTTKGEYQVYGDDQLFSFDNWINNIGSAFGYFSAQETWYGTIALVYVLGILGALIGVVKLILKRREITKSTEYLLFAAALSILGLIVIVFSYYWGDITQAFTIRLGIIFLPFLVFPTCYLVNEVVNYKYVVGRRFAVGKVTVLAGLSLCLYYWPVAAKNEGVERLTLNRQYQHTLAFLEENYPDRNNLVVTDRPGMYSVHGWGAVHVKYAWRKHKNIVRGLERGLYRNVIVIQEVYYESEQPNRATALPENIALETLFETQFDALKKLRISRVIGAKLSEMPEDAEPALDEEIDSESQSVDSGIE